LSNWWRKCIVFEQWSSSWQFTVANEIHLDIYRDKLSSTVIAWYLCNNEKNIYLLLALFTLFVIICVWWCQTHIVLCFLFCLSSSWVLCIVVSNTYCLVFFVLFVFVLCFVYPISPVSLDCPFLIYPSVFSNVYLIRITEFYLWLVIFINDWS